MSKKIIPLIFIFLGFLLFSLVAFIGYDNAFAKLSDYKIIQNQVVEKGFSKTKKDSKIFYFKVFQSKENFAVYRITKNYEELNNEINIGDKIKVYFQPSNPNSKDYNLDVIQIEKQNKVILKKSDNTIKYTIIMITGILAALFMIYAAFHIIKYGDFENPIPPIF